MHDFNSGLVLFNKDATGYIINLKTSKFWILKCIFYLLSELAI